ncbi:MAG: hypothetical protein K0Q79_2625 [Flavipsychrobacter sp.]|jgi:hypothetical protein|nr:hypothetical protein [Flavipsychrobacter sp.]
MKKIFLFIALIIGATSLKAQQNAVAKPGAAFKFVEETHDFGALKRGPVATYSFEFTNTGDQPLIIMDVKPSCGCTNVDWPKAPVKPGEKGKITLGVKSEELHGVFHKEVYILSNAVNNPRGEKRYTVYVKGEAKD